MDSRWDHAKNEESIYKLWEKSGAFSPAKKGNPSDSAGKPYTILMPPPNANASLHAGHGMYVVDDILVRWKRMQGYSALWQPGMDHAGFETQFVYEKHLGKEGKSRMDFDRETLYNNVADFVKNNSGLIYGQFKRLGFSADWSRSVFTLESQVLDQVYKTFKKMSDENLVYRQDYLVNYCTKCGTSLSELETNHEERVDHLYYIKYGPFVLATVRPETKFGDTAVAVHPEDKRYQKYIGKEIEVEGLLGKFKLKVIADEFVDPKFGTGVVKVTPGHDPNDFEMGKRHNLEIKQVIDLRGKLTEIAGPYAGMNVKAAREKVALDLDEKGLIEKIDRNYLHSVTVCYKCKRDLEPMVVPNWFIKVKTLKEPVKKAVRENKIKFYPARFKKQMLNWLEIMHDWPISRQIAWGIRIPAWYDLDKNPNLEIVFLDKKNQVVSGKACDLLKRYNFEEIEAKLQSLVAPNDAKYVVADKKPEGNFLQETDTFDTWFSSGQWPLVTLKEDEYKNRFPTDVMGTLSDILKFWVSRMIMFSLYWKGEVPFKDVYLWSMVADKNGQKMSKSKGNVINPIELVDKYGADAFRMALLYGVAQGSKIPLSEEKVKGMRNFANKIWNAARFIEMMEDKTKGEDKSNQDFELKIKKIVRDTDRDLEKYQFGRVTEMLYDEFWHWFCDEAIEEAKRGKIGSEVLKKGLNTFLKLLHPFMPFVTEAVWKEMGNKTLLISEKWPE